MRADKGSIGSYVGVGILLVCICMAAWIIWQRQLVVDYVTVRQFTPSKEVTAIADRASMSEKGRFYFYASQPEVDDARKFNEQCSRHEEHSAILGCYSARKIYIYNISNSSLDGIKEVTAAHEMLHAVWDRLNGAQKRRLESLLETEYQRHVDDDLKERMAYYARNQSGERSNELHSIIGTEYADVSNELEEYYAKYFTDRSKTTSLHKKYKTVFDDIDRRSSLLVARLDSLSTQVEKRSNQYNAAVKQLNTAIEGFNQRAQSGGFASQSAFAQERAQLVSKSNQLNTDRQAINQIIREYEIAQRELKQVNSQSEALTRSIDSTLAPLPDI